MRSSPLALCLLTLATAFADPLTQGERDRALSELYASRKQFLDSIAGLSEAQWKFKPAPGVWSIAECAEHIALSEDVLFGRVREVMQSPTEPQKRDEAKGKDALVLTGMRDRSRKFQAPEVLVPTHRWPTPPALIVHFKESRDRTLDYVRATQDDLRNHFSQHPVLKTLDAYQWILLIAAHTERHTAQLNEVKQNPNYPK
jgi:DinB superfamily